MKCHPKGWHFSLWASKQEGTEFLLRPEKHNAETPGLEHPGPVFSCISAKISSPIICSTIILRKTVD